jgi:RHS repeat-associated protein
VGNLTRDFNAHTFSYDAENHQVAYDGGASANGTDYKYDGDGRRVKKVTGTNQQITIFIYDASGQMVAEYSTSNQQGSGGTSYLTMDSLGTPRVVTGADGSVKARHDYLPFGEEVSAGTGGRTTQQGYVVDNVKQKFTQKERDVETGLDYFGARYYASTQGRFTSADPMFATKESFLNPQRWNLYVYVNNNPLVAVDPTGGDGQGQGGDKTITVVLEISLGDRNTNESLKYGDVPAPNWQDTKSEVSKSGYSLNLIGNNDVTGESGLPLTPGMKRQAFEGALKTSEVTLYVGHGIFYNATDPGAAPYAIKVGDTYYASDKTLSTLDASEGPKPVANSAVIGNLSCNSAFRSDYFTLTGKGFQVTITVNGGRDGASSLGTLEKAANAFVKVYASTKGTIEEKAMAGAIAAQKVFDRSRAETDQGDRIVPQRKTN